MQPGQTSRLYLFAFSFSVCSNCEPVLTIRRSRWMTVGGVLGPWPGVTGAENIPIVSHPN